MSQGLQEILKPFRTLMTVLWGGLIAAVPVYLFVAFMMLKPNAQGPRPDTTLLTAFALLAMVLAAFSLLVPRYFPRDATIRQAMSGNLDPGAYARSEGGVVDEALAARIRTLDAAERKVLLLRPLFQLQSIMRWAFADSIAVLGFVLVLSGHEFGTMLPFAGAALVLMVVAAPRFETFVERATELQRT